MLEKIEKRTDLGPFLIGPFLRYLCHGKQQPENTKQISISKIITNLVIVQFQVLLELGAR